MPRSLRLLGLWVGLSAGTAWGQQPPPPANSLPVANGLDLGLLKNPRPELPNRDGFFQGTDRITDPAATARVPPTFGTANVRPIGDWAGLSAERTAPGALPRITAAQPGGTLPTNGPVRQAGYSVPAPVEQSMAFDPGAVEVRFQGGRWVWTDGRRELRDFGAHQAEAQTALQMARELRATQYAAIGTPWPVLEYWLTDGKASEGILSQREVVPFEPEKLRVEQFNGVWVLRDQFQVLCNFGAHPEDAQQALAVCQRYGFNQLGIIGRPKPVMTVLLFDPNRQSIDRTRLTSQQAQPVPREALYLPNLGWVGDLVKFDPRRLEVVRRGRDAVLRADGWEIAAFGLNEMDAHLAARTLQDLRINQFCRIGASGGIFLSFGRAPVGMPLGLRTLSLHPDRLDVREINGTWVLADGSNVLFRIGPDAQAARQALAAVRHYGFDTFCQIGYGEQALRLLVKSK